MILHINLFQVLVWNAFLGIIIGLCIALPILVIATNNIAIGFLATCTLICITIMVLGFIPIVGWKIGVSIGCLQTNTYQK